jgi:hypothetical protein
MTIFDKDCPEGRGGLLAELGDATVLDCESEGEARASFVAPPPLLEGPPPCVAEDKAAAEEASCEGFGGAIVRDLAEDSSWPG